jgi:hypothetical protein
LRSELKGSFFGLVPERCPAFRAITVKEFRFAEHVFFGQRIAPGYERVLRELKLGGN